MNKQHRVLVRKDDPEIRIQIPVELYEELVSEAVSNRRSQNLEIIMRLASTLENGEIMATDKLLRTIFNTNGNQSVTRR